MNRLSQGGVIVWHVSTNLKLEACWLALPVSVAFELTFSCFGMIALLDDLPELLIHPECYVEGKGFLGGSKPSPSILRFMCVVSTKLFFLRVSERGLCEKLLEFKCVY